MSQVPSATNLANLPNDIVLRAGEPRPQTLTYAYREHTNFPGVYGFSVLFHPGWDADALARADAFPHGFLCYAAVHELRDALKRADSAYDLRLTHTPSKALPDHHTFSVTRQSVLMTTLPDDAANALGTLLATHVMRNPYQRP